VTSRKFGILSKTATLVVMAKQEPKIVLIGGGTGSFTILQGLKEITSHLTAIVNMSDDGGSTGMLRDELGVLPPGDVRQCLVALSGTPEIRDLFSYRFNRGSLANQSLGNVILSGLELKHGSLEKAIKIASSILHIAGRVVPVTLDNHTLILQDGGQTIRGQYVIVHHRIQNAGARITHDPVASINPEAAEAIRDADLLVIAPGNFYGSLMAALAVNGMAEAWRTSQAHKVVISNLVNKPGQTDDWHIVDYIKEFEKHLGQGQIDTVIYNNKPPTKVLLQRYAADREFPVLTRPDRFTEISATAIGHNLVAKKMFVADEHDTIVRRTLIRHDAKQVSKLLLKCYRQFQMVKREPGNPDAQPPQKRQPRAKVKTSN
jgi:uncharacterized cofD-like protein